jgi:transcriptional regulator with XRE-family HTH domain
MRLTRPTDIGALVRDHRRARKVRQADLAARLQVSPKWLSQLENGKPTIQLGLALRVLRDLGITLVAETERAPLPKQSRRRFSINDVVDG